VILYFFMDRTGRSGLRKAACEPVLARGFGGDHQDLKLKKVFWKAREFFRKMAGSSSRKEYLSGLGPPPPPPTAPLILAPPGLLAD